MYNIHIMLDQRQRRWVDVVKMVYKCFFFSWATMHNYQDKLYLEITAQVTEIEQFMLLVFTRWLSSQMAVDYRFNPLTADVALMRHCALLLIYDNLNNYEVII